MMVVNYARKFIPGDTIAVDVHNDSFVFKRGEAQKPASKTARAV